MKPRETLAVMQPNLNEPGAHADSGLTLTLQPALAMRAPVAGTAADGEDARVHVTSGEPSSASSSRRCRANSHSHSRSQPQGRTQAQSHSSPETEHGPPETDLDNEPSSSFSELRCLLRWLQKSLPFLIILCAKLVLQHALGECISKQIQEHSRGTKTIYIVCTCAFFSSGLAVGVGLYTTFLYANKSIQTQVFLRVRESHIYRHFQRGRCHELWYCLCASSGASLKAAVYLAAAVHGLLQPSAVLHVLRGGSLLLVSILNSHYSPIYQQLWTLNVSIMPN